MNHFFILTVLVLTTVVSNLYAIPAFARQMGVSCNTCHSQNGYPSLNSFGRNFKASGFTMMGAQRKIENAVPKEKFLSIPDTLNLSIVAKIRALKSDNSKTELQFPDELALVVGGRISEHVGTFLEIGYDSGDNTFGMANFKLPITYKVNDYTLGLVPFSTDGFGAAAAFEVLNTGAVRGARVLEERKVISAQQYIGTATKAQGLGAYVYSELFNVVYSAWAPENGNNDHINPAGYLRVAMTPQLGDWDIGFGGQYWFGTTQQASSATTLVAPAGGGIVTSSTITTIKEKKVDAYAVDFQAMGKLHNIPVSFFATYANAKHDADSFFNSNINDKHAATALIEVAVIPSVVMLSTGYREADNGKATNSSENAAIIGAKYFLAENVELQTSYVNNLDVDSNTNQFLFMFYAAF